MTMRNQYILQNMAEAHLAHSKSIEKPVLQSFSTEKVSRLWNRY